MNALTKVLTLVASMLLATSALAQVSAITVGSGQGVAGETGVVIPVSLTANGDNIAGIDMTVTFTTASQYANLSVDCGAQTVSGNVFPSCSVSGNEVSIQLAETASQAWVSGLLANITVDVDAAAVSLLDDPLVATIVGVSDNLGNDITFPTTTNGAFTVPLADQVITDFISTPASGVVFGDATLSANASSGLTVVFGSNTPSICTVSDTTVSFLVVGTCIVTADQPGNGAFNPAPQETLNIAVGKADQVITNFEASPASGNLGGSSTLSAMASSGLAVTFGSATPTVCMVSGNTVTYEAVGTCTVTANQAGDVNYNSAPQETLDIAVGKADQTISGLAADPASGVVDGSSTLSATASSGLPVTFGSSTLAVCTVAGSTVNYLTAGTCTVTADQVGDDNYNPAAQETLNITVAKADQVITDFVSTPANGDVGDNTTLSATGGDSGNAVTFGSNTLSVCTVSGNTVTLLASGTCTVTADQAGDDNYNAATQATLDIGVAKSDQTISGLAADPASGVVDGSSTLSATASSGLPVTFGSSTPAVCTVAASTVSYLAAGTCTVTADQAGDDDYNAAPQVTLGITVAKLDQTISDFISTPANGDVGDTTTLSATGGDSGNPVTFASITPSVCTVSGNTVTLLVSGTCTVTADQAGDDDYNDATQVTLDIGVAKSDQTISGLAADPASGVVAETSSLSATASSGLPVSFGSSTPAVCSVSGTTVSYVAIGTCTVTADQAGDDDYNAAPQVTLDITVTQGSQTIVAFAANPSFGYIGSTSTLVAVASSGLTVTFGSNTPFVCEITGDTVTYLEEGVCTVTADQAGDDNYAAAPQALLDIDVTLTAPTAIPTLSQWGLLIMFLVMLGFGGLGIRRERSR